MHLHSYREVAEPWSASANHLVPRLPERVPAQEPALGTATSLFRIAIESIIVWVLAAGGASHPYGA